MSTPMQPPNRPKGENHKITIANQDRQIEQLCQRVADLSQNLTMAQRRADDNYESAKQWRDRCSTAEKKLEGMETNTRKLLQEVDYQRGYIARVKEGDRQMFGENTATLNSVAPGV